MSPNLDIQRSPAHEEIRMVVLLFGKSTDFVGQVQRPSKVFDLDSFEQFLAVNHLPTVQLPQQHGSFRRLKRWHTSLARHASLSGQTHVLSPAIASLPE